MSYALRLPKLSQSLTKRTPLPWSASSSRRTLHEDASSKRNKNDKSAPTTLVRLKGLPTTATPSDIRRMARNMDKNGTLSNITDIKLDYWRFCPTGRATIEVSDFHHAGAAAKLLNKATLSALPITALRAPHVSLAGSRRRGAKGRWEAAERAVLDGNGPGAGIAPKGCDVVMYGLPGATTAPALRLYLQKIGIVGSDDAGRPKCEVVKIPVPKKGTALTSRFFIRLNSVTEAHSFVRRMHMTFFFPEVWGTKFLIRSRVIY